ncbi:hypothetical protein HY251_07055 [bacterium]|nr:hypothetical protein [bacterium]
MSSPKLAFETDQAVLAVFEPRVLQHRMREPRTWWREGSVLDVPEVLEGKLALFPIGDEGSFTARLSLDAAPLTDVEKPLHVGTVSGLGVLIEAGDVFVGAAERLPGDGIGDRIVALPGTGAFLKAPPGEYLVSVHVLDWRTKRTFFDEDGEPLETAPPDFVVALAPRERAFDAPLDLRALTDLLPRAEASKEALRVPRVARSSSPVRFSSRTHPRPPEETHEEPPPPPAFGFFELPLVKRAFRDVLRARSGEPSRRFAGGALVIKPRDEALQPKEVPVEDLLSKVTRLRDQLRVLEQKVNAHGSLEESAKLDLDAQVSAVYDALVGIVAVLAD